MKKRYLVIMVLIVFIFGITLGFFLKSFSNEVFLQLGVFACHDGCSIATKDDNGYLTNKTWDCWDSCDNYIREVFGDLKWQIYLNKQNNN